MPRETVKPERPPWATRTNKIEATYQFSAEVGRLALVPDDSVVVRVRVVQFYYSQNIVDVTSFRPGPVAVEVRREGSSASTDIGLIPPSVVAALCAVLSQAAKLARVAEAASADGPVDLFYVEPSGWRSRPQHCRNRAEAEQSRDATNSLSGADARSRRRWHVEPCACPAGVGR
jgi:hypothetical protein